jgi:hypothetical protein
MTDRQNQASRVEQAGSDLFDFAIDREDVKWLMDRLPKTAAVKRPTVEYELQALKIITVGWCIAYQMAENQQKTPLLESYWGAVQEFCRGLNQTTELMIGQDIDYFSTLHARLDMYVKAIDNNPETQAPAAVIGPTFAYACGNAEDIFTSMTGAKMFAAVVSRVKAYLDAVAL